MTDFDDNPEEKDPVEVPPRDGTRFLFEDIVKCDCKLSNGNIEKINVLRMTADNAEELISVVSDNMVGANHMDYAKNSDFHGRSDIRCFDDFKRKVFDPWPEGLAMYDRLKPMVNIDDMPKPTSIRRRHVWSEDGGEEANIDRWRQGDPFWSASKRTRIHGSQVVTVMVDLGAAYDQSAKSITWRAVAGAVLVELLENAGYRVEVRCFDFSNQPFRDRFEPYFGLIDWPVKRATEPLDVSTLINMASAWFFRIGLFAAKHANRRVPSAGLGGVLDLGPFGNLTKLIVNGPVFVVENCFSLKEAGAIITSVLRNFVLDTGEKS